jgi:hypothetical protein
MAFDREFSPFSNHPLLTSLRIVIIDCPRLIRRSLGGWTLMANAMRLDTGPETLTLECLVEIQIGEDQSVGAVAFL